MEPFYFILILLAAAMLLTPIVSISNYNRKRDIKKAANICISGTTLVVFLTILLVLTLANRKQQPPTHCPDTCPARTFENTERPDKPTIVKIENLVQSENTLLP